MPMVRARRTKQPKPFLRLASFAIAFLLFTASAFFYAQDGKPVAAPTQLPVIPGIQLPTDKIPEANQVDSGRELLPAPAPAMGRKGTPSPDLLPPAVMKPARPDAAAPDHVFFDGGVIQATYRELSGRRDLVFTAQDKGAFAKPIGTLNWDIADKQFVNGGLDPQFRTYCCEPLISVTPGRTYKFKFDPIDRPEYFNQPDDEDGRLNTIQRTRFIRELYGKYYNESVSSKENAAAAFQVALWELVSESTPQAENENKFSLFNGTFRTTFDSDETSPEYVRMGEKYLKSLSGDDRAFFENPTFEHMELVRLTGLPGEDNSVPQSQYALRPRTDFAGGAGAGLANATNIGGSSPLLMASGGSRGGPLLGSGSGMGGGGFPATGAAFGGGGGSTTSSGGGGTGTGTGTDTGTGSTGNVGGGGTGGGTGGGGSGGGGGNGGGGDGGGGGGTPPITPVPAPPAVLLALAGVGVLAGGQMFRRRKA
ncbi:MAG: hypothetical protein U0798_20010 [Gemmataceae bacterium]